MSFLKNRDRASQMPDVNLVPMMDVIMTILTFFIVVSMTLTQQQNALNVTLPSTEPADTSATPTPDPLIVGLNKQGQIAVKDRQVTEPELAEQIQTYLTQNPQGAVLLKADRTVSYEQLASLLSVMQKVGGEKVSLAIESN